MLLKYSIPLNAAVAEAQFAADEGLFASQMPYGLTAHIKRFWYSLYILFKKLKSWFHMCGATPMDQTNMTFTSLKPLLSMSFIFAETKFHMYPSQSMPPLLSISLPKEKPRIRGFPSNCISSRPHAHCFSFSAWSVSVSTPKRTLTLLASTNCKSVSHDLLRFSSSPQGDFQAANRRKCLTRVVLVFGQIPNILSAQVLIVESSIAIPLFSMFCNPSKLKVE